MREDRRGKTLKLFREIGFDTVMSSGGVKEEIFFIGPRLVAGSEEGEHATHDAVLEFISYWSHQIQVAANYLENGRCNKTHEWRSDRLSVDERSEVLEVFGDDVGGGL